MADKKDSMEKLLKLYALATRGVGGERENARRLLNRLLEKTGETIESVELAAGAGVTSLQSYSFTVRKYFPGFSQVLAQLVFSFGLRDACVLLCPGVESRRGGFAGCVLETLL